MDRGRVEFEPWVLIKKLQSGFPRVNDNRLSSHRLFVNKLRSPVDHFPAKQPASLRPNSIKGNRAAFRSKFNDDFTLVHWASSLQINYRRQEFHPQLDLI